MADEIGGGGFAVGSGDADDGEFFGWIAVEEMGEFGGGSGRVLDGDLREGGRGQGMIGDDGHRAARAGLVDEFCAFGGRATAGDEEIAGGDETRIVADSEDGEIGDE